MTEELFACDKCWRPMNEKEVRWHSSKASNGLPIKVAMCEDCYGEIVVQPVPTSGESPK